jgi:hypothetical protein
MRERGWIDRSVFGPETVKAGGQAFDQAWARWDDAEPTSLARLAFTATGEVLQLLHQISERGKTTLAISSAR